MSVVDARGMRCPWPALRAARALRDSDSLDILADDPVAPRELAALAGELGMAFTVLDAAAGRFRLARRTTSTDA